MFSCGYYLEKNKYFPSGVTERFVSLPFELSESIALIRTESGCCKMRGSAGVVWEKTSLTLKIKIINNTEDD